jgi:hypothetical protein
MKNLRDYQIATTEAEFSTGNYFELKDGEVEAGKIQVLQENIDNEVVAEYFFCNDSPILVSEGKLQFHKKEWVKQPAKQASGLIRIFDCELEEIIL